MSDHDHAAHHEHGTMQIAEQERTYGGFVKACAIVIGVSAFVLLYLAACVA
ncbi:aa3-type cytochrome c oxidase subunit IV [Neomegalonema sp.]|uniref:aa3-type cytochrome c oxidase subunit IV n=1 Tax=Neomegalonema sp. TaxID=2039713 RepID=UPI00260643B1|nr:aa3-type cytochrome c oxidase subunit IV [Neomegalonema sp.]MDD2870277.1 aa3-type cytochrome c oxidase subunit IV [Neomegalonema sp.]